MLFVEFGALFDYRTTHRFDDRLLASSLLGMHCFFNESGGCACPQLIDYGSRDSGSSFISIRYDFQPRCLLRKVMEAAEAFSGIGGIETISS